MKSKTFPVTARALAVIAGVIMIGACTTASGGGGGGNTGGTTDGGSTGSDAVADGKASVDIISGTADAGAKPGDAVSSADAGSDALSANAKCCAEKNAKCGYVPGCTNSCGGCPSGEKCDTTPNSKSIYTCVKSAPAKPLKKNGEACGPNAECVVPPNNASDAVQQEYYQCLNNQCEGGRCIFGVCTSQCKIAVDVKNNATGEKVENGDGIEDPDSQPSDCSGFVDGPAGKDFKCVQWFSPASPNQVYFCAPGTNFAPCKANADCKGGEVCSYRFVRGNYVAVCAAAYKEADGKPAQSSVGGYCNGNPKAGQVSTCKNNFCGGAGCIEFCKSDDDCVTEVGACKAGKCPNGDACSKDAECSAWTCKKDSKVFGADQPGQDVCLPKSCYLDEDCKNPAYYCLTQYNGVKNQEGDPDPKDPGKILMPSWESSACVKKAPNTAKKGEPCDDFPGDDDVTLKPCENKYWCVNATCEGHCKADKDCPSNSKCGVFEIPLDTSDPQDQKYDVFTGLKVCTPMPGATNSCLGQSDCKGEAKAKHCRPYEVELAKPATGTAEYKYTISGLCIEPEQGFGDPGMQCGPSNGKSCKSGICLGTQDNQGKTLPGWCTDFCNAKTDCPQEMTFTGYNNQKAKPYCSGILWGHNGTASPLDNLYIPVCLPDVAMSSLSDCSSDFKCSGADEACTAIPIMTGPDKPAVADFRCRNVKNNPQNDPKPTKKVGESCNPNPAQGDPEECISGMCMPDSATGKGYCSSLCKDNAACGSNDGMFCDTEHQLVARKDPKMSAKAPLCLKKKSCIPCAYDYQCATGNLCTWPDAKAENGRCAPPCETDADCAKTDGGGKCEAQKDWTGKATNLKTCTPTNCK